MILSLRGCSSRVSPHVPTGTLADMARGRKTFEELMQFEHLGL